MAQRASTWGRDWALGAAVLPLVLACRPDRAATPPAVAGTNDRAPAATVTLAYRPAQLRVRSNVELTTTGGGRYVEAHASVTAGVEVTAEGDRLVFAWTIKDVEDLSLQGTIFEGDTDLAGYLEAHGTGAWVIDVHGAEDFAASEAHPRNAARRRLLAAETARLARAREADAELDPDPAATLLELVPPLLLVPRLPSRPLTLGRTHEERSFTELELPAFDLVLPIDTSTKTTWMGVDDAGATSLAELQIDVRRFGGVDTEAGTVELDEHVEGTLLFDLDRGAPVRLELTSTQSFIAGERGGDTTTIVRADYDPVP